MVKILILKRIIRNINYTTLSIKKGECVFQQDELSKWSPLRNSQFTSISFFKANRRSFI